MEALSKILNKEVEGQYLGGFIVNGTINDPLNVSHLLFADDVLIFFFCQSDTDSSFEVVLVGLKMNLGKSKLVPMGVVPDMEELAYILRCKVSHC